MYDKHGTVTGIFPTAGCGPSTSNPCADPKVGIREVPSAQAGSWGGGQGAPSLSGPTPYPDSPSQLSPITSPAWLPPLPLNSPFLWETRPILHLLKQAGAIMDHFVAVATAVV